MDRQTSDLRNKVVIVPRVDRGFSREAALFFAEEGARVVLCASVSNEMSPVLASGVAFEIAELGGEAIITAESSCANAGAARIVEQALDTFGRVDVLLNCDSVGVGENPVDLSKDERNSQSNSSLSVFNHISKAVASLFVKQQAGSFINSITFETMLGPHELNTAKTEMIYRSAIVARKMLKDGVRSNCIFPSDASPILQNERARVEGSNIVSFREKADLRYMARLCGFLASENAKGITGQVFEVTGHEIALLREQSSTDSIQLGSRELSPRKREWRSLLRSSIKLESYSATLPSRSSTHGGLSRSSPLDATRRR